MSDLLLDDLYTSTGCSDEFIKDISKRMQVPHRISFGPVDNLDRRLIIESPEPTNMRVPERIMVMSPVRNSDTDAYNNDSDADKAGESDTSANVESPNRAVTLDDRNTYDLNADEFEVNPVHLRPSMGPPPSTLVLTEVIYPDVSRVHDECDKTATCQSPTKSRREKNGKSQEALDPCEDPTVLTRHLAPSQANNSAHLISNAEDSKRLLLLERRVNQLEQDHLARQQLDRLGLMITGVYFVYRILHWIATHF